jgi:hypothetical protein
LPFAIPLHGFFGDALENRSKWGGKAIVVERGCGTPRAGSRGHGRKSFLFIVHVRQAEARSGWA